MAKNKDKKAKSRADQVRSAVDQAFQQATPQRWSELTEEVVQTAGRVFEALEELRPVTHQDLEALRTDLKALEARVAKLEQPAPRRAPAKRAPAASAARSPRSPAKSAPAASAKPAAAPAARRPPAAKRSSGA